MGENSQETFSIGKKILLINHFVEYGGAEQFNMNLYHLLKEKGHTVKGLFFDKGKAKKIEEDFHIIEGGSAVREMLLNPIIYRKAKRYIDSFNPDLIIVNNIKSSLFLLYMAVKGYKTIQVVHDYSIICPAVCCVRMYDDKSICRGYRCGKCLQGCKVNDSRLRLWVLRLLQRPIEGLRKKYIEKFIAPTAHLAGFIKHYGYDATVIHNMLDGIPEKLPEKEFHEDKKSYMYAGNISNLKGINIFAEQFLEFSKDINVVLDIYGTISEKNAGDQLYKIIKKSNGKIRYHHFLENRKLRKYMEKADYFVMPSVGMDSYPSATLEAMASGTVVIGSARGGIPEMIKGVGFLYKCLDKNMIMNTLRRSYEISKEDYENMRMKGYLQVKEENTFEKYYKELIDTLGAQPK